MPAAHWWVLFNPFVRFTNIDSSPVYFTFDFNKPITKKCLEIAFSFKVSEIADCTTELLSPASSFGCGRRNMTERGLVLECTEMIEDGMEQLF